jgi:3',5'-cyclic AMP phosphodiesterase CpdA
MNLTSDPPIARKIERMAERVRRGHPALAERRIDQTRLVLEGAPREEEPFSFLVIGDSGTRHGSHRRPQREVAERLLEHREEAAFLLHTGDVVYQVGSAEQYPSNFIEPYREWLVGGEHWRDLDYRHLRFRKPFLPVPGNHDYYDLPPLLGLLSGLTLPLRRWIRPLPDLDVAWHGSFVGEAYARAFLDLLQDLPEGELAAHLERHYTAIEAGSRCLLYRAGHHTRLPHRYYSFRHAGVEFLALDSNTFNEPLPGEAGVPGGAAEQALEERLQQLQQRQQELLMELMNPLAEREGEAGEGQDAGTDRLERIEEIDEEIRDLRKQLRGGATTVDREQLDWLRDRLIGSWRDPHIRGRILVLHHPPYSTERSKWDQAQTRAVRRRLRHVLDQVAAEVDDLREGRPLVDLILTGHAHCLEVLRTGATGHGDAHLPLVVCGGSGYSLRRQRREGAVLQEGIDPGGAEVARSALFLGRVGHGRALRRPYTAVRIDVNGGRPMRLEGRALVAEKAGGQWQAGEVPLPLEPA